MFVVLVVVVCLLAGTGLEPVIPPRQLCVLRCGVPARAATTGYGIVAAQPSSIGEAASSAAYSPCSHTELSQYNYHILMLQDWTVCRLKYRGASDVNIHISIQKYPRATL